MGAGGDLRAKRVLVLGAGGTARAAIYGVASAGASVVVANRTANTAKQLAAEFSQRCGDSPAWAVSAVSISKIGKEKFDVVINCTSAGMQGGADPDHDPLPLNVVIDESMIVFDAVYVPTQTPLLRRAAERGAKCVVGWEMFIAQASHQFEAWTGSKPPAGVAPSI